MWRTVAFAVLASCGRVDFDPFAGAADGRGSGPSADATATCTTWSAWSTPPQRIVELASIDNDFAATVTADERTLVLDRCTAGGMCALHLSTRPDAASAWSTPMAITNLNTASSDDAGWNALGTRLYYAVANSGPQFSTYDGSAFSAPTPLPELPSGAIAPTLSTDELEMFYTLRAGSGLDQVARATRTQLADPWTDRGTVAELNLSVDTGWPSLSGDGLEIYVEDDSSAVDAIYVATRPAVGGAFSTPVPVPELDTQTDNNGDPELSRDGTTMWFSSDRPGGSGGADIYTATRACL